MLTSTNRYSPKEIKPTSHKLTKPKTKEHKALITGKILFEDAQFQLDMTDIEFVDLS